MWFARKIQVAYRRWRFRLFQDKVERRALKICASQDHLNYINFTSLSLLNFEERSKSYYQTSRLHTYDGSATPPLSERKKSVSFCETLEEVYYIPSLKSDRAKSAERRRFRFERQYITPLQKRNRYQNQQQLEDITETPTPVKEDPTPVKLKYDNMPRQIQKQLIPQQK